MAAGEARRRRHQPAVDGVAPFPVEPRAGLQMRLGAGHRIGAEAGGRAGGLAAQRDGRHRDAELQPDQVIGLVHRGVAPRGIGTEPVFAEAGGDIVGAGLEHGVDAPAQVLVERAAVPRLARDHLDLALVVQGAAV